MGVGLAGPSFDDRMASRLANPLLQTPTNWLVPIILVDSVLSIPDGAVQQMWRSM